MATKLKQGDPEHLRLLQAVSEAFRPAAPIDRRELFAGRAAQLAEIFNVVMQPGQHAVVYGERGVGKTSLTTVAARMLGASNVVTARATCDRSDDFGTVWRKVFDEIQISTTRQRVGFAGESKQSVKTGSSMLRGDPVTPHVVRKTLESLSTGSRIAVVVHEFDRLASREARGLFADTLKMLSDQLVGATVVLVGVADDVDELVAEHESVERALVQIHMPRMSPDELREIVERGLDAARMTMDEEAVQRIVRLSQGLPHYTHLVAQLAARLAIDELRTHVTLADVEEAVARAIERAQQGVREAYDQATFGTRRSLYPKVVLAASLAPGDEFGFFGPADVKDPLSRITGRPCPIPSFAQHLDELAGEDRGRILQRRGSARRYRYRFHNPLLQPYVIMRGLSEGQLAPELLRR